MSDETKTQFRAGLYDLAVYKLARAGVRNVTVQVCNDGGSIRLELSGRKTDLGQALWALKEFQLLITTTNQNG